MLIHLGWWFPYLCMVPLLLYLLQSLLSVIVTKIILNVIAYNNKK